MDMLDFYEGMQCEAQNKTCVAGNTSTEERKKCASRLNLLERENALFRNLLERTREFNITVYDVTEQHRMIYANDAACRHFGVDKATLLRWTPYDFNPAYDETVKEEMAGKIHAGESFTFETEHRVASGELIPVEISVHPLEQDGRQLSVVHTRDIRERKLMEAQQLQYEAALARRDVEAHYRSLVESLPDFIVRLDPQARFTYVNPAMLQNAGRNEGAFLGKTAIEAAVMGDRESDQRLYEYALSVVASGKAHIYQEWVLLARGKRCFEIRHIPELGESEKVVSVLAIARDITEQVRIDDTLRFIAQRGWSLHGEPFLVALARYLSKTLDADYTIIDRLADEPQEAETVALFARGELLPNMCYSLKGTPCEQVMGGELCCYSQGVQGHFPGNTTLIEMGVESYIGLPLWDSTGKVIGLITVMDSQAITDQNAVVGLLQLVASRAAAELERERSEQALKAREQEYRALVENSPDSISRFDSQGRSIYINPSCARAKGIKGRLGKTLSEAYPGYAPAQDYQARLEHVLHSGEEDQFLFPLALEDGQQYCYDMHLVPERDDHGQIISVLAIGRDISERLHLEEELRRQASVDALTGLPNRWSFGGRLREEIAKTGRGRGKGTLLFIDLDRFKEVNDTLGHEIGDKLLAEAARRIQLCIRKSDIVARLGGDEFVVILPTVSNGQHSGGIAQKIIETLTQPFTFGEHVAYVSASIGIASYPSDATDADTLLSCADQAMYVAKEKGRSGFSFFAPYMQEEVESRIHLAHDLREGLTERQFELHFQPIVEIATGRVVKAEALLRWQHPQRGMVSPDQFIPVAEDTGMIHQLGDWVFHEAVLLAQQWRKQQGGSVQVSVNISPRQFMHGQNFDAWLAHLASLELPGACLAIEITEGLLLDEQDNVKQKLARFRAAGIQVALDDFGTGYSAMAYIKKFNIDYLKIDHSFVRDMAVDESDRAIAETIVDMAKRLGLKTIAEGVETTEQLNILAAVGCEYVQGYLYSRPLPADEFLAYVR